MSTPTYNVEIIPYKSHLFQLWDFAGKLINDRHKYYAYRLKRVNRD